VLVLNSRDAQPHQSTEGLEPEDDYKINTQKWLVLNYKATVSYRFTAAVWTFISSAEIKHIPSNIKKKLKKNLSEVENGHIERKNQQKALSLDVEYSTK